MAVRLRLILGAASLLGWGVYASRWRRGVVRANLELHADFLGCTGARAVRALVRRSYDHLALVAASLLFPSAFLATAPGLAPPALPRRLLAQLREGPVIISTAHVGVWELVPHALSRALSPGCRAASVIVYQPLHSAALNALVLGRRRRCGIELLPARGSWPRLVQVLEAGGVVGIVGDQRPHRSEGRALQRFLGRDVPFDDGIGRLHALTGAPVWFVAVLRGGAGERRRLVPHFAELSDDGARAHCSADCPRLAGARSPACGDAVMRRYAQALTECVVRAPEQYMWAHRRWRDWAAQQHDEVPPRQVVASITRSAIL